MTNTSNGYGNLCEFEDAEFRCRVCGLLYDFKPWGEDGRSPTFYICGCCGVEFGYEDTMAVAARKNRQKWIESGAEWFRPTECPPDWDLEEQLTHIPPKFR